MRLTNVRDLGLAVRRGRHDKGLTQQDLANRAAVSRQWVATLELGRSNPNLRQVLDALNALGLTIHVYDANSLPAIEPPNAPGGLTLDDILSGMDKDRP